MKKRHYDTPKAMLSLFATEDVIAASGGNDENGGENSSGNIWDGDTVIDLPPVKLP